jgi:hypothetical protein
MFNRVDHRENQQCRRPLFWMVAAAITLTCAVGCSSRLSFSVRVVDATNGRPIRRAIVEGDSRSELSAKTYVALTFGAPDRPGERFNTDENGAAAVTLGGRDVVEYGVRAGADGYVSRRAAFSPATVEAARRRRGAPSEPDLTISLVPNSAMRPVP